MRFVPAPKQSDEAPLFLSLAKRPVEFVLIANAKGRETFICHDIYITINGNIYGEDPTSRLDTHPIIIIIILIIGYNTPVTAY